MSSARRSDRRWLAKSDVPRVDPNMINFAFVPGATVLAYFPVAQVPEALAEIHPGWRGDMFLVAGDDIVIMDHSRRVVATLPGESTTGQGNPPPQRSTAPNAS